MCIQVSLCRESTEGTPVYTHTQASLCVYTCGYTCTRISFYRCSHTCIHRATPCIHSHTCTGVAARVNTEQHLYTQLCVVPLLRAQSDTYIHTATPVYTQQHLYTHSNTCIHTATPVYTQQHLYNNYVSLAHIHMGWLRLVGSLKLYVSFAKEPYKRGHILQKRPII